MPPELERVFLDKEIRNKLVEEMFVNKDEEMEPEEKCNSVRQRNESSISFSSLFHKKLLQLAD